VTPRVTRFAPSPTGALHLGHAYSALLNFEAARASGGRFLLRIEDIDQGRCRPEFVRGIEEDLAWLGLAWEAPVRVQSQHFADYTAALARLEAAGLLYRCICTRADIARATTAPHGDEGPIYPGTCKHKQLKPGESFAWRLHMDKAAGPASQGDIVIARKDTPTSYHLAVTWDDALQGVTDVIRGQDLLSATPIHQTLQRLLGLPMPSYHHHRLLTDADGRRYAKRDKSLTLASLRADGVTPAQIRARVGVPEGCDPLGRDLTQHFSV
jgi:glutamyl-Q tRNA(Asp) synthetase